MIERCNARVKIDFFMDFDDPRLDQTLGDGIELPHLALPCLKLFPGCNHIPDHGRITAP